jgi:hypothetical protein
MLIDTVQASQRKAAYFLVMADTSVATSSVRGARTAGRAGSGRTRKRRRWRPGAATGALAATALAYGFSQAQVWQILLGWDESIYLSQVSRQAPAAFFSAPRARGITWLAAPLQPFDPSVTDLRVYLSALSALALYLAFRTWFAVIAPPAAVLAALGFASLWVTRFYGAQLMPNLWVAFGLIAAVGGFLRLAADRRDRVGLLALPVGLAVAALMRPTDAAWVTAPLLLLTALVPGWRRTGRLYLLTVTGSLLGAAPWIIEAYQRFGGISARLHQASAIQGGLGWHPSALLQHWQTLNGPLLCRPCSPPSTPPLSSFWWLLIPVAAVIALALARATRAPSAVPAALVPIVTGAFVAAPYLLMVNYSAPRFVLPALGLLSLPVGTALHAGLDAASRHHHAELTVFALVVLVLVAQILSQQAILARQTATETASTRTYQQLAADLTQLRVRPPCVISGVRSPQIAFYTRCRSRNVGGHDASITEADLVQTGLTQPVAVVMEPGQKPPHYARKWQHRLLSVNDHGRPWIAYLAPRSS